MKIKEIASRLLNKTCGSRLYQLSKLDQRLTRGFLCFLEERFSLYFAAYYWCFLCHARITNKKMPKLLHQHQRSRPRHQKRRKACWHQTTTTLLWWSLLMKRPRSLRQRLRKRLRRLKRWNARLFLTRIMSLCLIPGKKSHHAATLC